MQAALVFHFRATNASLKYKNSTYFKIIIYIYFFA